VTKQTMTSCLARPESCFTIRTPAGNVPSVFSKPWGAWSSATRFSALIPSFCGSGVPEYPAMQRSTLPRLRAYRPEDAAFVEKLARSAFGEYSPTAGEPTARVAALPATVAIVAVLADRPVGFAILVVHAGARSAFASLDAIAVEAACRGRGLGRALLASAEDAARKRGALELRLVTAQANLAALDLFLRSGFEIVQRLTRYYPRGQDAVAMRKQLAS
jgi:ribosomal-protein-alanine N-acetyltransferase